MSDVTIKLRADSVEEFIQFKLDYYERAWAEARQRVYNFMDNRLKKTWFGLLLRPFTEEEKQDRLNMSFAWAERYYPGRLERIQERARWSKTNSGGFNEVYLSTYEFEDYIRDLPDQVEDQIRHAIRVIQAISVLADPA